MTGICIGTRRLRILPAALILPILGFAAGCAMHPERRQTVVESDFIEYVPPAERADLKEQVEELSDEIRRDFDNAELHRRLAVLYRLQGTPRSRLLSSEEIDRAIMLDPGNAMYRVEKGLTFAARRFVGEAEASFLEATKLDRRCAEAWYQLGCLERDEYLRTMCFPDHLAKAIDYYLKAHRYRRKHEQTLLDLGFLHSLRHMNGTGLQYALRAVNFFPRSSHPHLLCGMLYTRLAEFEKAAQAYAAGFLLMTDEERRPYESIALLLPPEERALYETSHPAKRADWNRRFWIENDPTPVTDINERLLEHFARVFIAERSLTDERLDLAGPQSNRGETLIRFGPPDHRYYDLGSGTSGAWIVWGYDTPTGVMRLYFHDEFLNGDYHFPIRDYYGVTSRRLLETAPPRYEYPIPFAALPIGLEMAERRGSEERTRVDFSLAIPDTVRSGPRERWNIFLTFFDSEWNRFSRNRLSFRPDSLPRISKPGGNYFVYSGAIELLPRELGATCVVELSNDESRAKGTRRCPLAMRDLYGRSLKVSSVRFTIPEGGLCGEVLDPIPSYPRRGTLCLGYEVYNVKLADGASHYRVTYAIKKPDPEDDGSPASLGRTLAYIWATIRGERTDEKPYIESSFEQRSGGSIVSDNLQIELGSLEPGVYLLALFVEDLNSGQTAGERRMFTVHE